MLSSLGECSSFWANRQAMVHGRLASGLPSRPLIQIQQRAIQRAAYALTSEVNQATLVILGQTVIVMTEMARLGIRVVGPFLLEPFVTIFTIIEFALVAIIPHRVLSSWASRLGRFGADAEISSIVLVHEAISIH